jgi:hypothetical protein
MDTSAFSMKRACAGRMEISRTFYESLASHARKRSANEQIRRVQLDRPAHGLSCIPLAAIEGCVRQRSAAADRRPQLEVDGYGLLVEPMVEPLSQLFPEARREIPSKGKWQKMEGQKDRTES